MRKFAYSFIISLCLLSCKNEKSKAELAKENLPGTYFELKEDKIKVFLPVYFQEFSKNTYQELIDALPDSKEKRMEQKRFDYLKYSKGNTYYFRDIASSSLVTVKMMKYIPFSRKESSQLLGLLSSQCSDYAFTFETNCEKITAGYSGNSKTSVFRAVFELTNEDKYKVYNTTYLVSSNYKTFSMSIYSNTLQDYNTFISKTVIK